MKKIINLFLIVSTLSFTVNAIPQLNPTPQLNSTPLGLYNFGASCYMNASVQCLANIPELRKVLIENKTSIEIVKSFTNLLEELTQPNPTKHYITPEDFWIKQKLMFFDDSSGQQDADEFLMQLLDRMPQEAQDIFTTNITIPEQYKASVSRPYLEGIDYSPKILKLQNNIPFEEGIRNFFYNEGILKKITKLPNILILRLGRDKEARSEFQKDNSPIPFQVNNLDLKNYLEDPGVGPAQYDLIGIVCHQGASFSRGHYYSYVKDSQNNNWYQCDDRNVKLENLAEIERIARSGIVAKNETPYILFYKHKENVLRAEAASEAGPPLPIRQTAPSLVSKAEMKYEEKETDVDKAIRLSQETAEAEEIARQVARKQEELDKTLRFRKQQEEALAAIQKQREEIAKAEQERLAKIAQEQKDQEVALLIQKQFEAEETQRRLEREEADRLIKESLQRQLEEQRRLKLRREQEQQQHQEEFRRHQEIAAQRRLDEQKRVQEEEQRREEADRRLAEQVQREEQERLAKIVPAQPQIRRQPVAPAQPVKVAPLKEVPQKINDPDIKNKFKKLNELFNKKAEPKIQIRLFEAIKKLLVKYNIHLEQKELDQSVMDYLNSIIQK